MTAARYFKSRDVCTMNAVNMQPLVRSRETNSSPPCQAGQELHTCSSAAYLHTCNSSAYCRALHNYCSAIIVQSNPRQACADHQCLFPAFCLQIASALDAILARELDVADAQPDSSSDVSKKPKKTPKPHSTAQPTAHTAASGAAAGDAQQHSTPTHTAAAGDASADAFDDGAGVQLFKAVPKGAPCIIQPDSMQAWEPQTGGQGQQQQTGAAGAFGSASIPRKQPLREQIPRLSLAERSRQSSKRKHQEVLEALAVDGHALQVAAVAAGYTRNSSAAGKKGSGSTKGSSSAGGASSNTAGWVKGWKRLKGQKVEGVVKEAKPWVPYEVRAAKLLGTAPMC
jgi:hypothetical protein